MTATFSANTVLCPACRRRTFTQDQPWKVLCVTCYLATGPKRRRTERAEVQLAPPAPSIPADMLRRLIQLCHPDRHGGSEAATLATRWLLEQREATR